ncbi:ketol-acid reductoisomerase [Pilimelia columellifera]|uniref:Ketol-acid reductoisomerase n=1 Tax=Pilimelia columellifera subsp. columellifera TaxID=706583 RepID=A0ABP6ARX9_9ACTN
MSTPVYHDDDADLSELNDRKVAIIGYGDHGAAQALSLRDSGVDVRMGLPPTSVNRARAEDQGLRVLTPGEAAAEADLTVLLAPLALQRFVYTQSIAPGLAEGDALLFTDAFPIHYGLIDPPAGIDVLLLAPMADGEQLRRQYHDGKGVPSFVAVERDASGGAWRLLLAYAKGVGATRAGALATTFSAQAEVARFGEQAVVGGAAALVAAGFDTLVGAGLPAEAAYVACVHQLKTAVDALYAGGLAGLREIESDVARYGSLTRGPRVVDEQVRQAMRQLLDEIRDGRFVAEWMVDENANRPTATALREQSAQHPVEPAGDAVRAMLPWLGGPIR